MDFEPKDRVLEIGTGLGYQTAILARLAAQVAEDARVATDAPIDLTLGLLTSVLNAITFISVLWSVGGDLEVQAFGVSLALPGYLVITVTGYSVLLAAIMLFVGRRLTPVIEQKNQAEAALRSTACRLRELGEGTAMWNDALPGDRMPSDAVVQTLPGRAN